MFDFWISFYVGSGSKSGPGNGSRMHYGSGSAGSGSTTLLSELNFIPYLPGPPSKFLSAVKIQHTLFWALPKIKVVLHIIIYHPVCSINFYPKISSAIFIDDKLLIFFSCYYFDFMGCQAQATVLLLDWNFVFLLTPEMISFGSAKLIFLLAFHRYRMFCRYWLDQFYISKR